MAKRRRTPAAPVAPSGYLAPAEMPAQSYQWNKRVTTADPAQAAPEPYADPSYAGLWAPADPTVGGQPQVAAPVTPGVVSPPAPAAAPVAVQYVASPPVRPSAPAAASVAVGVWGIAAACVAALGLPAGAFALMHSVSMPGIGGTNWGLVIGLVALALTVAAVVGHLTSERRYVGGPVRAGVAAGLSLASSGMLLWLIDTHPRKFGFDLSFGVALLAIVPAALAAFVAYRAVNAEL